MITQIPATLHKVNSMSKRSWRLTFDTQEEIPNELITQFANNLEAFGWLAFLVGQNEIQAEDIKDLPELPNTDDTKSPAQRLRDRMFVFYKERFQKTEDFNNWYISQINKIGEQYLDKLN